MPTLARNALTAAHQSLEYPDTLDRSLAVKYALTIAGLVVASFCIGAITTKLIEYLT